MAQKKKSAYATRQPRFTAGGKLACCVCWLKDKRLALLNGNPDGLKCYVCGTTYIQKPHGLSFNVNVPSHIVEEARRLNGEQTLRLRKAAQLILDAKAAEETTSVDDAAESPDNN